MRSRPISRSAMLAVLWAFTLFPVPARAQRLQPGTRVRVTYDCDITMARDRRDGSCRKLEGLLIGADSLGITVAPGVTREPVQIRASTVTRVEVSVGWRGHPTQGALLGGLVVGTAVALGANAAAKAISCDVPHCGNSGFVMLWGFVTGFPLGALIGQAVGAAVISETWHDLPVERGRGGAGYQLGIGWSVRF